MENSNIKELVGKIIIDIKQDSSTIIFRTKDYSYHMYHEQDCCEGVYIEDIIGDLQDLLNSPITMSEEISDSNFEDNWLKNQTYKPDSFTWTFYRLATVKGYVTIRWLGESNGYYSEYVSFKKCRNK